MKKTFAIAAKIYPNYLRIIPFIVMGLVSLNKEVRAQNELDVIHNRYYGGKANCWIQFSDAPNSLYHHIASQAYELLGKRAVVINGLHSLSDWQNRQEWIRKTLNDIVGPFPDKTPLNATVTRIMDKKSYRVEHIIYESQPGLYVTSSLFIPDGLAKKNKAPAVIYCSGHADDGYHSAGAQIMILNLVKKGFIVFAFDPVSQGERFEYRDPKTGKSIIGGTDLDHSYSGAQAFIMGSSQARYMIWDGIRAVDYLLSRKEVDPFRIGITGLSGGGTQSAYIAAFDDRILGVAPACFITNFTRIFQSPGPQDAEQDLTASILRGIDHADLLEVRAPKPSLIIAATRDDFSIQGARETAKEVSGIYRAFGKENNFGIVEIDQPHLATKETRVEAYKFFQKCLNNPGNPEEVEIEPLSTEEMRVTKTGQVSTSVSGETVYSLNCKEAEKLDNALKVSRSTDLIGHLSRVLNSARDLSGYKEPLTIDEPVFTGRIRREGYVVEKYFVSGEGNYIIPYLLMIPYNSNKKALVYIHPIGKITEALPGGEIEWFVRKGFTVLAPDMIGIGEMGPGDYKGDSYIEGISYNIWFASILIGRSIVGIRAGDVVRLVRLLEKKNKITTVYALARKEMAPVLLHAAAFDTTISRLAFIEPYSSYSSIVMNHFYKSAFIYGVVPGALKSYDIPDLAASLAPRKLLMAGMTDGNGKIIDATDEGDDLSVIRAAYQLKNAGTELNIVYGKLPKTPYDLYTEWIK